MSVEGQHLTETELHALLDGALDPTVAHNARSHLNSCRACSEHLAEAERLFAAIEGWQDIPLRRDLSPVIVAAIAPAPAPVGLRVATAMQAGIAALLLLLAWPLAEALLSTLQVPMVPFLPPGTAEMAAAQLADALLGAQADLAANLAFAAGALRDLPGWLSTWPLLVGGALALAVVGNSILLGGARNHAAATRRL